MFIRANWNEFNICTHVRTLCIAYTSLPVLMSSHCFYSLSYTIVCHSVCLFSVFSFIQPVSSLLTSFSSHSEFVFIPLFPCVFSSTLSEAYNINKALVFLTCNATVIAIAVIPFLFWSEVKKLDIWSMTANNRVTVLNDLLQHT